MSLSENSESFGNTPYGNISYGNITMGCQPQFWIPVIPTCCAAGCCCPMTPWPWEKIRYGNCTGDAMPMSPK